MTDKTREVYKETPQSLTELNPFVDMPRMRVDAVNRLNELIKRDGAMAVERRYPDTTCVEDFNKMQCPICKTFVVDNKADKFCRGCGQRLDTENIAF